MAQDIAALFQDVDWNALGRLLMAVLPIWLFGAAVGFVLPRPKWLSSGTKWGLLFSVFLPYLRELMIGLHGMVIAAEVWNYLTIPGAFQTVLSCLGGLLTGKGFHYYKGNQGTTSFQPVSDSQEGEEDTSTGWYITKDDLEFFRDRVERDIPIKGSGQWELICDKSTDELEYTAYRRSLPNGTTEYKSTTISYDATAPEFMDFFLHDPIRAQWDNMITHTNVVENGDFGNREQVVRWLRTFPFSFLSDREYVLARRAFSMDNIWYGITKAVRHPDAPVGKIVRVDDIHSMWRSRTIPSPRGNGELACETILLHCENMKVPERLARFAVRHGMWGFVKKMGPCTRAFLSERRKRIDPFQQDPMAFGHEGNQAPSPHTPSPSPTPLRYRSACKSMPNVTAAATRGENSNGSSARSSFSDLCSIGEDQEVVPTGGLRRVHSTETNLGGMRRNTSAKKIGALLALGMAITMGPNAVKRSRSTPRISPTSNKPVSRRSTITKSVPEEAHVSYATAVGALGSHPMSGDYQEYDDIEVY